MKPKWETVIFNAAVIGKRFDHDEDCPGTGNNSKCILRCAAGPANVALDEIAEALKVGIPITADKY